MMYPIIPDGEEQLNMIFGKDKINLKKFSKNLRKYYLRNFFNTTSFASFTLMLI